MKHRRGAVGALLALASLVGGSFWLIANPCGETSPRRSPSEIGSCWLLPTEGASVVWKRLTRGPSASAPQYPEFQSDESVVPKPVRAAVMPRHPFMAAGGSNMHNDASMSDVYVAAGPRGDQPQVKTRTQGFGGYGTLSFDRAGRIVAVYSNGGGFQLELMDPLTLRELASYDLPPRPWYFPLQGVLPWKYIGAGMYFYLDEQDRAVVPTTHNTVEVIQTSPPGNDAGFKLVRSYDLSAHVVAMNWPQEDSVAWVLPEWSGKRYWYATLAGMVGTIDVESGAIRTLRLDGEIVENSFAIGDDGIFVISDYALYRFNADADGRPAVVWRTAYDRGPAQKPGHITRGSGSTVTLLGANDGLVAITDNAEPRIHVELYRRRDGVRECSAPVFAPGQSGTDLSVIGFEHANANGSGTGEYSMMVENSWGHHSFPRPHPIPGLTRVDARRQQDGALTCGEVWASAEKSLGIVKLSLATGLAYMYGPDDTPDATGWYFIGIDFSTGHTAFRRRSGIGHGFNNWQGALFLHPTNGALYTTTIFGLVMMRDGDPAS